MRKTNKKYHVLCVISLLLLCSTFQVFAQKTILNPAEFRDPPVQNQIYAWWHWMTGYITKEGISKDLEAMKAQDIQSATILNVFRDIGAVDCPQIKFGSSEWYNLFKFALKEAKRLGMTIGAANCDGWSESGGPWIKPENSMKQFVWRKTYLEGGKRISIKLNKPIGINNYYQDAYVVAYRSTKPNSFVKAAPIVTYDNTPIESLTDGNPISNVVVKKNKQILIQFNEPFFADQLAIMLFDVRIAAKLPVNVIIEAADDNTSFKQVANLIVDRQNELVKLPFNKTNAKNFRLTVNEDAKIGEIALLKHDEINSFEEGVSQYVSKTVAARSKTMNVFWAEDKKNDTLKVISSASDVIDLTDNMDIKGTLHWKAPTGNWTVIRFGFTTTGETNHPASPEGVGLECDKMDTTALNIHFRNYPQKLIDLAKEYKGTTFTYFLLDSWEAGVQNWTNTFAKEFEKRRGYNMIQYIPVLCGEVIQHPEYAEAFLQDYRKTVGDLIVEYYFKHLADLCHRQGMKLYSEGIYGDSQTPPVDALKTYQYCDVPMTEFWSNIEAREWPFKYVPENKTKHVIPEHSALLYNKPLVAAESYTGMAIYSDSPLDLKLYGDAAFTNGVNSIVLHTYTHQPIEKKPGLTLGIYGQTFNRHNTWFPYAKSFFDEQARVQYLLQKGVRMSDALVYIGDKMPAVEFSNKELENLLPGNTKFNYCNSEVLLNRITVKDGELMLDKKYAFEFLVIRDKELNLETLKKIESLVKDGAVIFAPKPEKTLTLKNFDANNADLVRIADKMWGTATDRKVKENTYDKGKVVWSLDQIKKIYAPDIQVKGIDINNILYLHKKSENDDVYYLVNTNNFELISFYADFRIDGKAPSIWDPMDGKIYPLALYYQSGKYTCLPLTLRAKQSIFVVFSDHISKPYFNSLKSANGIQLFPASENSKIGELPLVYFNAGNSITVLSNLGGKYSLMSNRGEESKIDILPIEQLVLPVANGTLTFVNEPELGRQTITKFVSFTESNNSLIKYYAGEAVYNLKIDIPTSYVSKGNTVYLQLEQFGSTANIEINAKKTATIWDTAYKVDITDFIKAGDNDFTIKVTNPWRNRLIGDKILSRGTKDLWTTSPMIKKNDPIPIISKDASLIPGGISKSIKIFCEHPVIVEMNK